MLGVCCIRFHVAKLSLTDFKLCATTPNNMQQGVQLMHTTCNIQQCWELLANNRRGVHLQGANLDKPQISLTKTTFGWNFFRYLEG